MSKTQLFIPNKIKVGFNIRRDTYTGMLGYIIYHDGKTWRKEGSWESWRQKEGQTINDGFQNEEGTWQHNQRTLGNEVNPLEFDNVPTEGFVLNKKAGGYSSGWNHRQTYCRVFDPRGFEFEVNIPNLLFILQESNSMKGKGLEGEFVYAWEGKDLVLLPAICEEYKKSKNFTDLQSGKIGVKDLVPGCSYQTKRQENLIYIGRFNWYNMEYKKGRMYYDKELNVNKKHIFISEKEKEGSQNYTIISGLASLASRNSDVPISNYSSLVETFSKSKYATKPVGIESERREVRVVNNIHGGSIEGGYVFYIKKEEGVFRICQVSAKFSYNRNENNNSFKGFTISENQTVKFKDGNLSIITDERNYGYNNWNNQEKVYSQKEIDAMNLQELYVNLESGAKIKINKY